MPLLVTLIAIVVLFYVLGRAADLIVAGIQNASRKLGIRVFVLGIVLGFFTSTPELSIAVHSIANNLPRLSVGNLLGGIFVLLGFILGGSIIVRRSISTESIIRACIPIAIILGLPLVLAFDGALTALDGWALIVAYVFLLTYLYIRFAREGEQLTPPDRDGLPKDLFFIVSGVVLVGVTSYALVTLTTELLQQFALPTFLVGLVVFSLGTNLPEILITVRSWRQHIRELSLSNLLGSAIANVLIIGLTAATRTIPFSIDVTFALLAVLMLALLTAFVIFSYTRHRLSRWEGAVLLGLYILFVFLHSGLLVAHCTGMIQCS